MEISGRTLKGFKLTKYSVKWDSVDLATAALCAAVYGGGLAATGGLSIIPGVTWIRPANIFGPLFGMLFGMPGAIGIAVGNLLADSLSGSFGWASIGGGFIGNFLLAYIPYKLVCDPSFKRALAWFQYYLFGVLGGSVWCAFYISWFLAVTSGSLSTLPAPVAWGFLAPFITMNNAIPFLFAPLLSIVLYPLVKSWGLYWKDRITYK
jgi:energy-coupling factor transport system substrate-specific component